MKFKTDEEISVLLSLLLQDISLGFSEKDSVRADINFRVLWNFFYNTGFIKTTKKRNEIILPVLFDIIMTYPIFMSNLQSKACALFCKLVRKPKFLPDNLHFPIRKVLYLYKMLFCQKESLCIMKKKETEYFEFFSKVRYFFNEDDAKYLIENYFYRLGNHDALSLKSLTILCRFFPPKYFKMIINDLLILLKNSITQTHSNAIISFIYHCIIYENNQYSEAIKDNKKSGNGLINFVKFEWIEHLDTFFNYALLFLNPKVNINGNNIPANFQLQSVSISGVTDSFDFSLINYISKVITLLIVDGKQGDEVLTYFEKFINISAPLFFTLSNLGKVNQIKREDIWHTSNFVIISDNNEIEFDFFYSFSYFRIS